MCLEVSYERHQRQLPTNPGVREMKRRGHPEGGSLRNPELTARRRCVGTESRVGRELAQPGGLLPGQAFPQAGPGPPPQPVRTPSFPLSGARRSPRASPPARTLTPSRLQRSPSNRNSATAPGTSHPAERGAAPRGVTAWRLLPVSRLSYWLLLRDRNCVYSGNHFPSGQKARFVVGRVS